jgi:hypothetical protein
MKKQSTKKVAIFSVSIIISALILISGWIRIENIKTERVRDTQRMESDRLIEEKRREEAQEAARQFEIDQCLNQAEDDYSYNWDNACNSRGLGDDCRLPVYEADSLEELRENRKENCLKRYK